MGLRALVMLGYGNDERVRKRLSFLSESQLPDGGFLCLHRLNKMKYIPKSCYKDNAIMLMLFAKCKKRNIAITNTEKIIEYFVKHNMFYRTDGQFSKVKKIMTVDTYLAELLQNHIYPKKK
jgi:hypothetical protein